MQTTYKKNGFTLIELLVVVAIIGILAAVGVTTYDGYTREAKRTVSKEILNNIAKSTELLAFDCDLSGKINVRHNGGNPQGSFKEFTCINENTNSMANLFMDHYHFSGIKNHLNKDSATWYWGAKGGAAAEGYIIFDGNPTSDCLVKISTAVVNPKTKKYMTLIKNISFHNLVNGC